MFFELRVLENFVIFTIKHFCWSFFLIIASIVILSKKTPTQVFPVNIAKFLRTAFITEHLPWLLPKVIKSNTWASYFE